MFRIALKHKSWKVHQSSCRDTNKEDNTKSSKEPKKPKYILKSKKGKNQKYFLKGRNQKYILKGKNQKYILKGRNQKNQKYILKGRNQKYILKGSGSFQWCFLSGSKVVNLYLFEDIKVAKPLEVVEEMEKQ
ncbi:hypothetical protein H8356DRAFT_1321837 [Neocallimastix lanati (nom. inval.)]|nr:hypothetical protein H8356DRAFT_1321837 [Neocallimastix sp. JGI-2020a]